MTKPKSTPRRITTHQGNKIVSESGSKKRKPKTIELTSDVPPAKQKPVFIDQYNATRLTVKNGKGYHSKRDEKGRFVKVVDDEIELHIVAPKPYIPMLQKLDLQHAVDEYKAEEDRQTEERIAWEKQEKYHRTRRYRIQQSFLSGLRLCKLSLMGNYYLCLNYVQRCTESTASHLKNAAAKLNFFSRG